jgi:glucose-6-phosphate dehydrogenase assembly protein OpcA
MLSVTVEEIRYFKQLDERQQRLYVGLKAQLLGWHGVKLVSDAYGVDVKTVRKGKAELIDLPDAPVKKIRKKGSGPKKK